MCKETYNPIETKHYQKRYKFEYGLSYKCLRDKYIKYKCSSCHCVSGQTGSRGVSGENVPPTQRVDAATS